MCEPTWLVKPNHDPRLRQPVNCCPLTKRAGSYLMAVGLESPDADPDDLSETSA